MIRVLTVSAYRRFSTIKQTITQLDHLESYIFILLLSEVSGLIAINYL